MWPKKGGKCFWSLQEKIRCYNLVVEDIYSPKEEKTFEKHLLKIPTLVEMTCKQHIREKTFLIGILYKQCIMETGYLLVSLYRVSSGLKMFYYLMKNFFLSHLMRVSCKIFTGYRFLGGL